MAQHKLDHLLQFIEGYRPSKNNLPSPPYTEQQILSEAKEFDQAWNPKVKSLQDEVNTYELQHPEKSFYAAFCGIIILTLGFVLQIIGSLSAI